MAGARLALAGQPAPPRSPTPRPAPAASRARIVAAADTTRRVEQDLHDDAQQRLVCLGLHLCGTARGHPAHPPCMSRSR